MEEKINKKQRMDFVKQWAEYVKNNKDWSTQQANLINSMIKNSKNNFLSKEEYFNMKMK